ncbi:MAG TPA: chromate resistance protein ChrB domain-containing protein, partial [Kofleriaceae bacterium]|nr:chromate resistance protein ChrB domain-containing protein [Kofleriaceae bacterium]
MLWVTRHTIRINRTATAWLIRRFIDPAASFRFVPAEEVAQLQRTAAARGFDAPGATYPHRDERGRCSFEALVDEYCAHDAALVELARIVHGADFADEIDYAPESAGLRAIAHGFP